MMHFNFICKVLVVQNFHDSPMTTDNTTKCDRSGLKISGIAVKSRSTTISSLFAFTTCN